MAGHSKWANIKVRKGSVDAKRAISFTRLSRNITNAIFEGGVNLEINTKLKSAIDLARQGDMPKENIDRLIENFKSKKENMEDLVLEGYAPGGVAVVLECMTDNKNRTLSELRFMFKKAGGSLGESGSVLFLFDKVGQIKINVEPDDEKKLELIDVGVLDIQGQYIYVSFADLSDISSKLSLLGWIVEDVAVVYLPKNPTSSNTNKELQKFLDDLEDCADVLNIYPALV